MKKLLLTLGTVAAVAAPVASVIACGSSNESDAKVKAEIKTMITDGVLDQTKYTMDDNEVNKLVDELFKLDGAKELAPIDILPGKITDPALDTSQRHNADDFIVILGGASPEKFTDNNAFVVEEHDALTGGAKINQLITNVKTPTLKRGLIGSEFDLKDTVLKNEWGDFTADTKDANFVLYLQHNDSADTVTVQLARIVTFDGKYFELDRPESAMISQKQEFNKEFALKEFTATKTVVTP